MTKKFVHSHDLPVARIVNTLAPKRDDQPIILHITHDITKDSTTKAPTSFWHTDCGKNVDYAEHNVRLHAFELAQKGSPMVKFCSRCGTQADFEAVYVAMREYDEQQRDIENRKREDEAKEWKAQWDKKVALLKNLVINKLLSNLGLEANPDRADQYISEIKTEGVTYRVTVSISEVEK